MGFWRFFPLAWWKRITKESILIALFCWPCMFSTSDYYFFSFQLSLHSKRTIPSSKKKKIEREHVEREKKNQGFYFLFFNNLCFLIKKIKEKRCLYEKIIK